jgi:hypothetical protein
MNTKTHAYDRVTERLTEAGYDQQTIDRVYWAAEQLAAKSTSDSEAIRLINLGEMVGESWSDRSNGSQVWAIVRNRHLVTVMLRRATQPSTPAALKVTKVTIIK